jgi:hypothetical protein
MSPVVSARARGRQPGVGSLTAPRDPPGQRLTGDEVRSVEGLFEIFDVANLRKLR